MRKGIEKLVSDTEYFNLLDKEDEIYTVEDLKERYK
jgi:hypothetical protein